jgi:hypothetical protein
MARSSFPDAVYRALLRLYPARFQEEFAADMALDFADASDEGWTDRGWRGLMAVWLRTSRDLVRSLLTQWLRTGRPLAALVGGGVVVATMATAFQPLPDRPLFRDLSPADRELGILILLVACLMVVIAATIIFTLWFLRPLLYRHRSEGAPQRDRRQLRS